jgi:hypothetical protein
MITSIDKQKQDMSNLKQQQKEQLANAKKDAAEKQKQALTQLKGMLELSLFAPRCKIISPKPKQNRET